MHVLDTSHTKPIIGLTVDKLSVTCIRLIFEQYCIELLTLVDICSLSVFIFAF